MGAIHRTIQKIVEPMVAEIRRETSESVQIFLADAKTEFGSIIETLSKKQAEFELKTHESVLAEMGRIEESFDQCQVARERLEVAFQAFSQAIDRLETVSLHFINIFQVFDFCNFVALKFFGCISIFSQSLAPTTTPCCRCQRPIRCNRHGSNQ